MDKEKIILSGDDECITVNWDSTEENVDLKSNQEEADTKVILHPMNVIRCGGDDVIGSSSRDTDIMVLALALFDDLVKVYFDYGNGKCRKRMCLGAVGMKDEGKKTLVGFCSFTRNEYISVIFRKGKKHCWSARKSNESLIRAFTETDTDWTMAEQQMNAIQQYVCVLYKSKKKSVNDVRYDLFEKKQNKEGKIINLSLIPLCFSPLNLQIKRANFVSKLWKSTCMAHLILPNIEEHGWNTYGSIAWILDAYPEDILDMLMNDENEFEDGNDNVEESEEESEVESGTSDDEQEYVTY